MGTDLGIRQHDDDRGRAVEGVVRGAHDGGVEPRQQSYRSGVLNGDGAWAVAVHSGGRMATRGEYLAKQVHRHLFFFEGAAGSPAAKGFYRFVHFGFCLSVRF